MRLLSDGKIIDILRCPVCGACMSINKTSLFCAGERKHCYDIASSGYVNLCSPTQSGGGDSKQAVRARSTFLDLGYYRPIADALAEVCVKYAPERGVLLDAGCGEGYYSQVLAEKGFSVLGADLSKFAVDAASKRLTRASLENFFFATASVFELPVADSSVSVLTNVFAPCVQAEYSRVLKNQGILAVAWAGERHLWGLKEAIYDNTLANAQRADLPTDMTKIDEIRVSYSIKLGSNDQIMSLFAMTPYYWRTSMSDSDKLRELDSLATEVDIIISVYKNDKTNATSGEF